MINANIVKATRDAITSTVKAENKWLDVGSVVRAEYHGAGALKAIRAEFIDTVIVPALGDDAVKVIAAEPPRKGSKEYTAATGEQQAAWAALNDAKATVRGKASVYFGRVMKYAFPPVEGKDDADEKATATTQAKLLKTATALLATMQKDEAPAYRHAHAVAACQALIAALTVPAVYDQDASKGSGQRRTK
jgi:hypothetical protein